MIVHQDLSRDDYPRIAFVAVRTVAVIERTLLDLLSDVERMDLARSAAAETVEVLAETPARMILFPAPTKLGCLAAWATRWHEEARAVHCSDGIHV